MSWKPGQLAYVRGGGELVTVARVEGDDIFVHWKEIDTRTNTPIIREWKMKADRLWWPESREAEVECAALLSIRGSL